MPAAEPHKVVVRKKVDQMDRLIQKIYVENLENYYIPQIENIILQTYDTELVGRVTDRKSRTNPIYYRDEFQQALRDFEWTKTKKGKTILSTPEVNTFDWNQGRLRILENILEGMIGTFIEVDEEQYIALYDKKPNIQPFDKAVPLKERIYLLRWSGALNRRWFEIYPRDELVRYPFSNTPPIDIFATANEYVNEHMRKWIDEALKQAQKEITL